MTRTIVLGWDGLDYELLQEFELEFCEYTAQIETYKNETIGEPHTREIWPTMITGLPPEDHGIFAATRDGGVKWSDPKIRLASRIAKYTVPETVKSYVGRKLRSRGTEVEKFRKEYYQDIGTVFDDRVSLPIAVPNYWTEMDDRFGFMFDRGAELSELPNKGNEWWQTANAEQQINIEQKMTSELGTKMGILQWSFDYNYDLVWLWDGLLDTAGHIEPVAHHPFQERAYRIYSEMTHYILEKSNPDDNIVCISDHGLQNGSHTMTPFVSSNNKQIVDEIDSVMDIAEVLTNVTPRSGELEFEGNGDFVSKRDTPESVAQNLEDLGYI